MVRPTDPGANSAVMTGFSAALRQTPRPPAPAARVFGDCTLLPWLVPSREAHPLSAALSSERTDHGLSVNETECYCSTFTRRCLGLFSADVLTIERKASRCGGAGGKVFNQRRFNDVTVTAEFPVAKPQSTAE